MTYSIFKIFTTNLATYYQGFYHYIARLYVIPCFHLWLDKWVVHKLLHLLNWCNYSWNCVYKHLQHINEIGALLGIILLFSYMVSWATWSTPILIYMVEISSFSSSFISNFTWFIVMKLDTSNYLLCVSQFLFLLRTYELLGIVEGTESCEAPRHNIPYFRR